MDDDQDAPAAPDDPGTADGADGASGTDASGAEAAGSGDGPIGPATHNPIAVAWETIEDDVAATAEEYRERGWDAFELHPGDVTPLSGEMSDRWGLDVLLPDDEFDRLEDIDSDHSFDESEVYRGTMDTLVFALLALEDTGAELVVLAPVFVDLSGSPSTPGQPRETLQRAVEEGELPVGFRPLDERSVVTVTLGEPELLLPDPEDADGEDG